MPIVFKFSSLGLYITADAIGDDQLSPIGDDHYVLIVRNIQKFLGYVCLGKEGILKKTDPNLEEAESTPEAPFEITLDEANTSNRLVVCKKDNFFEVVEGSWDAASSAFHGESLKSFFNVGSSKIQFTNLGLILGIKAPGVIKPFAGGEQEKVLRAVFKNETKSWKWCLLPNESHRPIFGDDPKNVLKESLKALFREMHGKYDPLTSFENGTELNFAVQEETAKNDNTLQAFSWDEYTPDIMGAKKPRWSLGLHGSRVTLSGQVRKNKQGEQSGAQADHAISQTISLHPSLMDAYQVDKDKTVYTFFEGDPVHYRSSLEDARESACLEITYVESANGSDETLEGAWISDLKEKTCKLACLGSDEGGRESAEHFWMRDFDGLTYFRGNTGAWWPESNILSESRTVRLSDFLDAGKLPHITGFDLDILLDNTEACQLELEMDLNQKKLSVRMRFWGPALRVVTGRHFVRGGQLAAPSLPPYERQGDSDAEIYSPMVFISDKLIDLQGMALPPLTATLEIATLEMPQTSQLELVINEEVNMTKWHLPSTHALVLPSEFSLNQPKDEGALGTLRGLLPLSPAEGSIFKIIPKAGGLQVESQKANQTWDFHPMLSGRSLPVLSPDDIESKWELTLGKSTDEPSAFRLRYARPHLDAAYALDANLLLSDGEWTVKQKIAATHIIDRYQPLPDIKVIATKLTSGNTKLFDSQQHGEYDAWKAYDEKILIEPVMLSSGDDRVILFYLVRWLENGSNTHNKCKRWAAISPKGKPTVTIAGLEYHLRKIDDTKAKVFTLYGSLKVSSETPLTTADQSFASFELKVKRKKSDGKAVWLLDAPVSIERLCLPGNYVLSAFVKGEGLSDYQNLVAVEPKLTELVLDDGRACLDLKGSVYVFQHQGQFFRVYSKERFRISETGIESVSVPSPPNTPIELRKFISRGDDANSKVKFWIEHYLPGITIQENLLDESDESKERFRVYPSSTVQANMLKAEISVSNGTIELVMASNPKKDASVISLTGLESLVTLSSTPNRAYFRLKRVDEVGEESSPSRILGGLIGWSAKKIFGCDIKNQDFHVTLGTNDGSEWTLAFNGSITFNGPIDDSKRKWSTLTTTVAFWDSNMTLSTKNALKFTLPDTSRNVDVLVQHRFIKKDGQLDAQACFNQRVEIVNDSGSFALRLKGSVLWEPVSNKNHITSVARQISRRILLKLEYWKIIPGNEIQFPGLRHGSMVIQFDYTSKSAKLNVEDESNHKFDGVLKAIDFEFFNHADQPLLLKGSFAPLPLSEQSPESTLRIYGGLPDTNMRCLAYSAVQTEDDKKNMYWLRCPIAGISEYIKSNFTPSSPPRLWIFKDGSLKMISKFEGMRPSLLEPVDADPQKSAENLVQLKKAAEKILAFASWRRGAVLEYYIKAADGSPDEVAWSLIDSPLLNIFTTLADVTGEQSDAIGDELFQEQDPRRTVLPLDGVPDDQPTSTLWRTGALDVEDRTEHHLEQFSDKLPQAENRPYFFSKSTYHFSETNAWANEGMTAVSRTIPFEGDQRDANDFKPYRWTTVNWAPNCEVDSRLPSDTSKEALVYAMHRADSYGSPRPGEIIQYAKRELLHMRAPTPADSRIMLSGTYFFEQRSLLASAKESLELSSAPLQPLQREFNDHRTAIKVTWKRTHNILTIPTKTMPVVVGVYSPEASKIVHFGEPFPLRIGVNADYLTDILKDAGLPEKKYLLSLILKTEKSVNFILKQRHDDPAIVGETHVGAGRLVRFPIADVEIKPQEGESKKMEVKLSGLEALKSIFYELSVIDESNNPLNLSFDVHLQEVEAFKDLRAAIHDAVPGQSVQVKKMQSPAEQIRVLDTEQDTSVEPLPSLIGLLRITKNTDERCLVAYGTEQSELWTPSCNDDGAIGWSKEGSFIDSIPSSQMDPPKNIPVYNLIILGANGSHSSTGY